MWVRVLSCLLLVSASPAVWAAKCTVDLESNDAMRFNVDEIEVSRSCREFVVNLRHTGRMPKAAMGHNVVVTRTADMPAVDADGIRAGAAADYVKPGDTRVVAHSGLIGGGEQSSLRFRPSALVAGTDYSFFCSFPGHSSMMRGRLKLVP